MKKKIEKYRFSSSIYDQLKPLRKVDRWHCWLALTEDWIIICFAIFISYHLSWYFYPLSILLIGSRQRALATLLHESAHQVITTNRIINFMMGTFFSGYLILQTFSSYRKSHVVKHHGKFGNPEEDPDYQFLISQGLYQKDLDDKIFQRDYVFLPLLLFQVPKYIKSLLTHRLLSEKNYLENFSMALLWLIIISLSILFNQWQYLILFWLIPYLTVFQIINGFIELTEHYPLMNNNVDLYMSRNRNSHFIEQFLTGMHNENYHLVHHLFPSIPFWNVPKAHKILMQDVNYAEYDTQSRGILWSKNNTPGILFQKFDQEFAPEYAISMGENR